MALKEFFTIPDPEIIQESSVDPMGLQVIWTYYGQNIFNDKLTTIANDLRVFTFNLFHHHLIQKLFNEHNEEVYKNKSYYKKWQTESDINSGLLIFLEDLVTHVFYLYEKQNNEELNKLGILGLSKARVEHKAKKFDQIFLSAFKGAGLLKNQMNLGMTGRYKGPMINMDFFDRSFTYLPNTWELVEKHFVKWSDAINLENEIISLITQYLFKSGNREYPRLSLQEIKSSRCWAPISKGYVNCFGIGNSSDIDHPNPLQTDHLKSTTISERFSC